MKKNNLSKIKIVDEEASKKLGIYKNKNGEWVKLEEKIEKYTETIPVEKNKTVKVETAIEPIMKSEKTLKKNIITEFEEDITEILIIDEYATEKDGIYKNKDGKWVKLVSKIEKYKEPSIVKKTKIVEKSKKIEPIMKTETYIDEVVEIKKIPTKKNVEVIDDESTKSIGIYKNKNDEWVKLETKTEETIEYIDVEVEKEVEKEVPTEPIMKIEEYTEYIDVEVDIEKTKTTEVIDINKNKIEGIHKNKKDEWVKLETKIEEYTETIPVEKTKNIFVETQTEPIMKIEEYTEYIDEATEVEKIKTNKILNEEKTKQFGIFKNKDGKWVKTKLEIEEFTKIGPKKIEKEKMVEKRVTPPKKTIQKPYQEKELQKVEVKKHREVVDNESNLSNGNFQDENGVWVTNDIVEVEKESLREIEVKREIKIPKKRIITNNKIIDDYAMSEVGFKLVDDKWVEEKVEPFIENKTFNIEVKNDKKTILENKNNIYQFHFEGLIKTIYINLNEYNFEENQGIVSLFTDEQKVASINLSHLKDEINQEGFVFIESNHKFNNLNIANNNEHPLVINGFYSDEVIEKLEEIESFRRILTPVPFEQMKLKKNQLNLSVYTETIPDENYILENNVFEENGKFFQITKEEEKYTYNETEVQKVQIEPIMKLEYYVETEEQLVEIEKFKNIEILDEEKIKEDKIYRKKDGNYYKTIIEYEVFKEMMPIRQTREVKIEEETEPVYDLVEETYIETEIQKKPIVKTKEIIDFEKNKAEGIFKNQNGTWVKNQNKEEKYIDYTEELRTRDTSEEVIVEPFFKTEIETYIETEIQKKPIVKTKEIIDFEKNKTEGIFKNQNGIWVQIKKVKDVILEKKPKQKLEFIEIEIPSDPIMKFVEKEVFEELEEINKVEKQKTVIDEVRNKLANIRQDKDGEWVKVNEIEETFNESIEIEKTRIDYLEIETTPILKPTYKNTTNQIEKEIEVPTMIEVIDEEANIEFGIYQKNQKWFREDIKEETYIEYVSEEKTKVSKVEVKTTPVIKEVTTEFNEKEDKNKLVISREFYFDENLLPNFYFNENILINNRDNFKFNEDIFSLYNKTSKNLQRASKNSNIQDLKIIKERDK